MPRKHFLCHQIAALVGGVALAACSASASPEAPEEQMSQTEATAGSEQRVILITGSTGGLGREVAEQLGATGAHIIVHGRDEERGREVVAEIERLGGTARFYRADLASLDEVREFGEAVLRDYDRLDVLINNAGIGSSPQERVLSEDGHELRFAVNYLSHYLLTRMLLPMIVESAPARIVNVASGAQTAIDFDDVNLEEGFSGSRAYAQSKLAQILFTIDLAEELAGTGVVVSSLHPATYMDTGMVRRAGVEPRSTVEEGAEAVLNLVESPDIESGLYYNGLRESRADPQAYDAEARARLREISQQWTDAPMTRSN